MMLGGGTEPGGGNGEEGVSRGELNSGMLGSRLRLGEAMVSRGEVVGRQSISTEKYYPNI